VPYYYKAGIQSKKVNRGVNADRPPMELVHSYGTLPNNQDSNA